MPKRDSFLVPDGTTIRVGKRYLFIKHQTAIPKDITELKIIELNDTYMKVMHNDGSTQWLDILQYIEAGQKSIIELTNQTEKNGDNFETTTT